MAENLTMDTVPTTPFVNVYTENTNEDYDHWIPVTLSYLMRRERI